jgi:N-acetylglucosamine kinase-like BadF-type ATPase
MMPRVQALGFEKFHLDHDAAAAWAGALECQPGVIVIAGTGSIAFGVNAKNERAIAGGWGWLLGDEGSGYWIGREALRTVCAMADGRRPLTPLMPAVLEHFGLSAMEQLVDYAYQQPGLSREPTAALTQVVLRCAREGDEASASIIGQAGWHLATTAGAVIDRLGVKGNGFVSYVGGVWEAHEFLMPTFSRLLKPFAHIVPPLHSSAVGAAMLARSAL